MTPTQQDMHVLEWVRERVEVAMDALPLFNESCARLESGVELTEGETELFDDASSKIRAASEALNIWDAWLADDGSA